MTYIMAVDDEPDVLNTVGRVLERDNFEIQLCTNGHEALRLLEKRTPNLLILDIVMPEIDGITLCKQLRDDVRFIALPILFLTARGTTDDIVSGLDAGADDYVVKPFEVAELRARVHALLRRGTRDKTVSAILQLNDLILDSDTYQLHVNDKSVQLTSTEHRLLRYLMEHANQALSPSHLLQAVWDYPPNTGDPDLVRAHVRNLRAKIENDSDKRYIRTIHGIGYMISN
jgi:two-component system, OmpR family, response regulator RpaA